MGKKSKKHFRNREKKKILKTAKETFKALSAERKYIVRRMTEIDKAVSKDKELEKKLEPYVLIHKGDKSLECALGFIKEYDRIVKNE